MSASRPRCTHYYPCRCPIYPEYAERPLRRDEWSPEWLQRPLEEENVDEHNDNKAILALWCWRYKIKHLISSLLGFPSLKARTLPKTQPFNWVMSSHHITEGYMEWPPPWGILMRSYFVDLPEQLRQENTAQSIKSWRKHLQDAGELYERTERDDAPSFIRCGRRAVFSSKNKDWLVIIYFWSFSRSWARKTDVRDLINFNSVVGIRAWEWVDAVDVPARVPYLFYELERGKKGKLRDTVFGGLSYRDYGSVPIQRGDPVPDRLSELRCCMNDQARSLLYAENE